MPFALRSLLVVALPLVLAVATPVRLHKRGEVDCCTTTISPLAAGGISILQQLGLTSIPLLGTGTIGIDCVPLTAQAVVDEQCVSGNIFACAEDLTLGSQGISLACDPFTLQGEPAHHPAITFDDAPISNKVPATSEGMLCSLQPPSMPCHTEDFNSTTATACLMICEEFHKGSSYYSLNDRLTDVTGEWMLTSFSCEIMRALRFLCVLALPLLAVATPTQLVRRVEVDCCPTTVDPLSPAGITIITQLLDEVGLELIPDIGTIGLNCQPLTVENLLDGECSENILACLIDLPFLTGTVSLGCVPVIETS
ncbi:hypothetical protein NM688_g4033 [Phlebia brevispora]|uniref:Uncharacterized protein n=1 Tax=Phlebia brevispora TaxID=194682 RepID=A0ACC1T4G5_9APHY|nr:hypothetical protein NM688_g4033 [Phlebia brevispora]